MSNEQPEGTALPGPDIPSEEQIELLKSGVGAWNYWREVHKTAHGGRRPDLAGAYLPSANLAMATLTRAVLTSANLQRANLIGADLTGANLTNASLQRANLTDADLTSAVLTQSDLLAANLHGARFRGTSLNSYALGLSKGLNNVQHFGPSFLDPLIASIQSTSLPTRLLRGIGWPNRLIESWDDLTGEIQFYSVFISYNHEDQKLASRVHEELQDRGVRCWFAPKDLYAGDRILDHVTTAIGLFDKFILCCSQTALASGWVRDEG